MTTSYTANAKLQKPATNDTGWGTPINANADQLDAVNAVGGGCVTLHETPSTSLNVAIAPLTYRKSDGTFVTYAGSASQAVTTATTSYLFLTDTGTLTVNTTGFPTTLHVRLAVVVAGATTITSITDARVPLQSIATQPSGASQAAMGSLATAALTDSTGGTASTTLAAISDTATKNAIASLAAQEAHTITDLTNLTTLVNALRSALVTAGVIKGSA